ncbi:hypothetical protein F5144DRAFT_651458 [Chaetomium tenue]|uniref:Uncharacterized protein n=1 Tax=Chaetomium tenue TaxID=1854479 RepID=A0ACB7P900_9PEZI|nr:hypothetical protein F5144DRAFT_651458 [Chaetomium globosum]
MPPCCSLTCGRQKKIKTSDAVAAAAAAAPPAPTRRPKVQAPSTLKPLQGNRVDNSISTSAPSQISTPREPSTKRLDGVNTEIPIPEPRPVESELPPIESPSAVSAEECNECESEPGQTHLLVPDVTQELPNTTSAKQLSANDYSVGWICAVPVEYVAAQVMLDEVHKRPGTLARTDGNDYVFGRVGEHNVVVTVLSSGGYGTTSATKVAADMQVSFPNVKHGLMVGIGGAAPTPKNDVRLGDNVVSVPGNGRPDVFQYDYGKDVQDRGFETTGTLNQPPRILLNAVAGLRADHDSASGGHRLEDAVNKVFEERPHLRKNYQRPGPAADHLFKSSVTHAVSCGTDQCSYENPEHLEQRSERASKRRSEIHYGLIASANQVMKNALVRDQWASKGVLCFEMEAAGLMNDFPCLVVRGLCDYSDMHKNKIWQGYAAMVAAAYAKDLLYRLAPIQGPASKHSEDEAREAHEILEWITPINYGPQQSDFLRKREPDTGQWLLHSAAYRKWADTKGLTLFCPGVPGAGKTILTATVIDNLCKRFKYDSSVGIAYLYLNFERRAQQTPEKLLASLAKQLLQGWVPLPESLRKMYKSRKDKSTDPSPTEILEILESAVRLHARTFIVVDGLDEYEKTAFVARLSEKIFHFQRESQLGISFFATSRPIPVIEKLFNADVCLRQRVLASSDDTRKFVNGHMDELAGFIMTTIINASGGMFLLAELYLSFLEDKTTPAEVQETLAQFLDEGNNARLASSEDEKREVLSRAYDQVTRRIESQKKGLQKLARRVLTWVFRAKQPLTEAALRHALGVQPGSTTLIEESVPRCEDVVSVCMGLVTVDVASDTIRFIHATPTIAATCVSYLSFTAFSEPPPTGFLTFEDLKARCAEHPLYSYAASYWGHHARESFNSPKTDELILGFLDREENVAAASQMLTATMGLFELVSAQIEIKPSDQGEEDVHEQSEEEAPEKSEEDGEALDAGKEPELKVEVRQMMIPMRLSAAHLIAHLGLERQVSDFLERGRLMDDRDYAGMSPLAWAAQVGHEAVVDLLLASHGVDVEAADKEGRTPLLWAMWFGREAVVERLLGSGRVSLESPLPAKPVLSFSLTDALVDDVYTENEFFFRLMGRERDTTFHLTQLAWAAFIGRRALVQAVLTAMNQDKESEHGGPVVLNARDLKYGRTPLWWAVRHGHREAAQLLLETDGVDPDARDNRLQSPLARAAVNGRVHLAELLLHSGGNRVDVNSKDKYGLTPLGLAASYGHEPIVRLLLAQPGIELNSRAGTVKIKVAQDGRNLNPRDGDGGTPLFIAAAHGHAGVVKLLLATEGVELDATDRMGRTPLQVAVQNNYREVVKLLSPTAPPGIDLGPTGDEREISQLVYTSDVISDDVGQLPRPLRIARNQMRREPNNTLVKVGSSESIEPVIMTDSMSRRWFCCCGVM